VPEPLSNQLLAVIMAGGEGTRLRPFTHVIPKPLLPIGRRPVAHIIIERLAAAGFPQVVMTLEYGAELIQAYFRNGEQFGLKIDYHREPRKLGTAGCLGDVPELRSRTRSFLVTNGDVLTDLDYAGFVDRHEASGAALTVATWSEKIAVRYGVMRVEDGRVLGVDEKPVLTFPINAGIYALSPKVLNLIPSGREFPMTDLINAALAAGMEVRAEAVEGIWFDLSCTEDFEKATARLEAVWPEVLQ
jgi:NDP-sugar pyrophosphorylase family protein